MNISNNRILITGGATGIGLGMAGRFLREKNTVIICGRRESMLKEAAAKLPGLITRRCDLSYRDEREALFQWISDNHGDLNVLVNNAGIQQWMSVTDPDFFPRADEEITINIEAPVHITSLFLQLPSLRTIINITSALAFVPLVRVPVYCATKSFFHSFTLSLRQTLEPSGIEVIEVLPPGLKTDLGGKGIHDYALPVSDFIDAVFEQLKAGKSQITWGNSESMVKAGPAELQKIFERMNQPH